MDPEQERPGNAPEPERSSYTSTLLVIVAFVVLALVVALIMWVSRETPLPADDPGLTEESTPLTGYVYFNDDDEDTRTSLIRRFNIEDETTDAVLADPAQYITSLTPLASGAAAYLTAPYVADSPYQFPYTDYKTMVVQQPEASTTERFTSYDISLIGDIEWSAAAGRFAFSGASQSVTELEKQGETVDYSAMANFSIYVEDESGGLKEISSGVSPAWSSDGDFIYYLSANGIHEYKVDTEEVRPVLQRSQFDISRWSTFAFTPDQNHLIMSAPRSHVLHVYEVTSKSPLEVRSTGYVDIPSSAPAYDLFPVGTSDQVGYAWYDEPGVATVTIFDVSDNTHSDLFSVLTHNEFSLEPVWTATSLGL